MRRNPLLIALATAAVLATSLVGVPATAAAAAPCDPNIGVTIRDGNYVKGSGSLPCAGTATLTLQRTWNGIWGTDLTWLTLSGAGDNRSVVWNCAGTGRYTYRTIVTWRTVGGSPGFKESNHIEFTC